MAALSRFIAHTYLRNQENGNKLHRPPAGHEVEPMYAFDIHCNGFFPVIVFFYFGNVSNDFSLSASNALSRPLTSVFILGSHDVIRDKLVFFLWGQGIYVFDKFLMRTSQ